MALTTVSPGRLGSPLRAVFTPEGKLESQVNGANREAQIKGHLLVLGLGKPGFGVNSELWAGGAAGHAGEDEGRISAVAVRAEGGQVDTTGNKGNKQIVS